MAGRFSAIAGELHRHSFDFKAKIEKLFDNIKTVTIFSLV